MHNIFANHHYKYKLEVEGPSGARLQAGGPSGRLWVLQACLTMLDHDDDKMHTRCHEKAVYVFSSGSGSGKLMNTILSLIKLIIVHFAHKLIFCIFMHFLSDFPHSQRLFFVANKHE